MIGIIIKVLTDMVVNLSGEKTLRLIYKKAGVEAHKVYSLNEAYSDDEWQRLLKATLEVMNISKKAAYKAYANAFLTSSPP